MMAYNGTGTKPNNVGLQSKAGLEKTFEKKHKLLGFRT